MTDPNRPPYRPTPDADLGYLPLVVSIVVGFFVLWLVMSSNDGNPRFTENVPRSAPTAPPIIPTPTPDPRK